MTTKCDRCGARSTRRYLRDHGSCQDCQRAGNRELHGAEREAVIREFIAWLAGRMPSEAIRQEAARHEPTALHLYAAAHAREHLSHGRSRPESRR